MYLSWAVVLLTITGCHRSDALSWFNVFVHGYPANYRVSRVIFPLTDDILGTLPSLSLSVIQVEGLGSTEPGHYTIVHFEIKK